MSYKKESTRAPGRPRDAQREAEILAVVTELLAEAGYDGVTFELVARRAGASKPTLYRRWSTKRDMVVAAIKAMPATGGGRTIDTGSLRGDLLALTERLAETLAASDTALIATLLQAGLADPDLCTISRRGRARPVRGFPTRSVPARCGAESCPPRRTRLRMTRWPVRRS